MKELVSIQQELKAPKGQYNGGAVITKQEQEYIRKNFCYDADTGKIIRSDRVNGLGSLDKDGYLILKIKSRQYKAHRVAWFLYYGEFPSMEIDHINRNRTDNRISNLRIVNREENVKNTRHSPNLGTGVIGIYIDNVTKGLKKKYTTRINSKSYRFYSLEEAINYRKQHGYAV